MTKNITPLTKLSILPCTSTARDKQLKELLSRTLDSQSTEELENTGLETYRNICEYLNIPFELNFGMSIRERTAEGNSLLRKIKQYLSLN